MTAAQMSGSSLRWCSRSDSLAHCDGVGVHGVGSDGQKLQGQAAALGCSQARQVQRGVKAHRRPPEGEGERSGREAYECTWAQECKSR